MRRRRSVLLGTLAAMALLIPASAGAHAQGSVQPRIVGGGPVSISQYPWQAAVVLTGSGNAHQRQFCGGELVTSRIVMTAGHCVFDTDPDCSSVLCALHDPGGDGTPKIDPNNVDVVLGRTTLSNSSEGAEVGIIGVAYQSNFDGNYQGDGVPRFDVGYLVLNGPSAQPQIKIAREDEGALWDAGSPVEISGWGSTSACTVSCGSTSDTLRAATVNVVSDQECDADYNPDFDGNTMVCASAPSTDTCAGDSGGPLEAPVGAGVYRLVGITGWGDGCAQPNAPGVYTRVAGPTMRSLIGSDVAAIESQFGLPAESPFASTATAAATKSKSTAHPFAKCRRIRDKKKRRRCVKKVRRKLQRG